MSNEISHSPAAVLGMDHLGKDILTTADTSLLDNMSVEPVFTFRKSLGEAYLALIYLLFHRRQTSIPKGFSGRLREL